jgi:hypothetical protein
MQLMSKRHCSLSCTTIFIMFAFNHDQLHLFAFNPLPFMVHGNIGHNQALLRFVCIWKNASYAMFFFNCIHWGIVQFDLPTIGPCLNLINICWTQLNFCWIWLLIVKKVIGISKILILDCQKLFCLLVSGN